MLEINRRKCGLLKVRELYFPDVYVTPSPGADLLVCVQSLVKDHYAREFVTLRVDLRQEEDAIFSQFGKNNRYKINRADKRDDLESEWNDAPDCQALSRFAQFYNRFARDKGLRRCNLTKLKALVRVGALTLSSVRTQNGRIHCRHAYVHDDARVRLLYSASQFRGLKESGDRALVGRANRLLHWRDIRAARDQGYMYYDFGGLGECAETQPIDDFKRSFGGSRVVEYNSVRGCSGIGRVITVLMYRTGRRS